ncbi:MAG: FeoA family protein [Phycisphaeraceae bacterium]|nr:FeoA family protein [Phycisphaeraceae bacterium]
MPSAGGTLARRRLIDLAASPVDQPVTVARIADQNPSFLRFAQEHGMVPGTEVTVTDRQEVAESVTFRLEPDGQPITIGTAAAEKVLVESHAD